ncbi:DUF427-domain-containing protein [Eremomyces bilateralis CBS 781.70]|uniref:DUF427-domain-containing protein n=1 Tax=Eremomyces bilateralis CBS 781.70 TaxID=1392243 RepID=A0A6G1FQ90_9PEZI|nr:DUF427-domain-containing protein [Eremomyces bilateralis CBS 781.70]KAF1807974.1 DUF427-domain-containing protein [Eremomyces bilateralis CBS 781.70]
MAVSSDPAWDKILVLAGKLLDDGPLKVIPSTRRIRVHYNNTLVFDTIRALQVWEHENYPYYYVPREDIIKRPTKLVLEKSQGIKDSSGDLGAFRGTLSVTEGDVKKVTNHAVIFTMRNMLEGGKLDYVRLPFNEMEKWYEEDLPIYIHPKDPFKRVDLLPSTRKIEVRYHGTLLASTNYSVHVLETSLPTRYYLPLHSLTSTTTLRPSTLVTGCPYKGEASWYHVVATAPPGEELEFEIGRRGWEKKDFVWSYKRPTLESTAIAGMICFFNEKVDIFINGVREQQPITKFS